MIKSLETPRQSRLAWVALACSALLCCPVTSLLGTLMGWMALRNIDASGGFTSGRRVAISAIVLGICMMPLQFIGLDWYEGFIKSTLNDGITMRVERLFAIEPSADDKTLNEYIRMNFVLIGGEPPSAQDARKFLAALEKQFGVFQSVSVVRWEPLSELDGEAVSPLHPVISAALVFQFDSGTATGGATCTLMAGVLEPKAAVWLRQIEISLPDNIIQRFPPRSDVQNKPEIE